MHQPSGDQLGDELPTTTTLLEGLKDHAATSIWQRFTDRFRPAVLLYARRCGLSQADSEDAAQLTLAEFCRAYRSGAFDRRKGRLRDWLFGIAKNQIRSIRRRLSPVATADLSDVPDEEPEELALWGECWEGSLLDRCLRIAARDFEPVTLAAFRLYALRNLPVAAVAAELGISENAVYIAKRRVIRRMRDVAAGMEDEL